MAKKETAWSLHKFYCRLKHQSVGMTGCQVKVRQFSKNIVYSSEFKSCTAVIPTYYYLFIKILCKLCTLYDNKLYLALI